MAPLRNPYVFYFVSGMNNVGKTSLSTNLAVTFARTGRTTLYINRDDVGAHGKQATSVDELLRTEQLVRAGVIRPGTLHVVDSREYMRGAIRRGEHDVVLVDYPAKEHLALSYPLAGPELAIVVTDLSVNSRKHLLPFLEYMLRESRVPFRVLLNKLFKEKDPRYSPGMGVIRQEYERLMGGRLLPIQFYARKAIEGCREQASSVYELVAAGNRSPGVRDTIHALDELGTVLLAIAATERVRGCAHAS